MERVPMVEMFSQTSRDRVRASTAFLAVAVTLSQACAPDVDAPERQVVATSALDDDARYVPFSTSPAFPQTSRSPAEAIDSLDFVAPCRDVGCGVGHSGGHDLFWYVSKRQGESGRAYIVKGTDQRCWERFDWDSSAISITFDNCWWASGYQYSRYKDGRWLARYWRPGDRLVADHTVYGGRWDQCSDTPIGAGQERVMSFVWRVKDYDWGPAGKLDTIAIRQSYPHEPRVREHYLYARGHGLIGWNLEDDRDPTQNKAHAFHLPSQRRNVPLGTTCVAVETSDARPSCELAPGHAFEVGVPVYSCNRRYSLVLQSDGNFVHYDLERGVALWSSRGGGAPPATSAVFQNDGNLVLRSGSTAVFASNTGGLDVDRLTVQDDGNVVLYRVGAPVWSIR
jgi:hypothetical protein